MMDTIEYRHTLPEDEDALATLRWNMQTCHHEYEPVWYADKGEEPCKASWHERFRHLFQDKDAVIVVASSSGTPVGMIVAHFSSRPLSKPWTGFVIASTVVHPHFRQKGIFKGMLAVLEDQARDAGISALKLSVHHKNEDAVH